MTDVRFIIKRLFLVLVFVTFFIDALAVTKTWNGSSSTNWNTAANWTPAGVPTPFTDDIVIVTGSGPCLLNSSKM